MGTFKYATKHLKKYNVVLAIMTNMQRRLRNVPRHVEVTTQPISTTAFVRQIRKDL